MRKLAAIMFTDIAGFTALMGEDESKALDLLARNRTLLKPLIEQHHGEWLKELGDGTLSSFASAVDAVNCAIEIQQRLREEDDRSLRIGIHLGDIVFEDNDVFGDGVNVASRIEPLAESGGICVSDRVYDEIQNKPDICTVFLGEKTLKNVKRPMGVYALVGHGLPVPPGKAVRQPQSRQQARARAGRLGMAGGFAVGLVVFLIALWIFIGQPLEGGKTIPTAVIDIINETGEPELNGLSGMLITAMEQSTRLSVMTRSRMFDILKQIGKEDVVKIDSETGREIARHAQLGALVIASVHRFDELYTIDLKVLDPERDEYIFTAREEGTGQASIPGMIDKLAAKTRRGMKEKATQIEARSQSVARVVTPNLEAYQHYFKGEEYVDELKFDEAIAEFNKAVELDSTFGLAYYRLAYAGWWILHASITQDALEKAMKLVDRIPEREQFLLRSVAASKKYGFEAAIDVLKQMEKVYPNDKEMIFNIGDYSFHLGDYETAEKYLARTLELDPTFTRAAQHLVWTCRQQGDYNKMLEVAQKYAKTSGNEEAYLMVGNSYLLLGEPEQARKMIRIAMSKSDKPWEDLRRFVETYLSSDEFGKAESFLKSCIADSQSQKMKSEGYRGLGTWVYPYLGRYRESLDTLDSCVVLSLQLRDTIRAAQSALQRSDLFRAGWSDIASAREERRRALHISKSAYDVAYDLSLVSSFIRDGEFEIADRYLAQYGPSQQPSFRLMIAACKGDLDAAELHMKEVRNASPLFTKIVSLYWLGKCRYEHGKYTDAIESFGELQNLKDNRLGFRALYYPLSFYQLGKSYEARGDPEKALENYKVFLDLWKDADPDLTTLIDAKERYARLHKSLAIAS